MLANTLFAEVDLGNFRLLDFTSSDDEFVLFFSLSNAEKALDIVFFEFCSVIKV